MALIWFAIQEHHGMRLIMLVCVEMRAGTQKPVGVDGQQGAHRIVKALCCKWEHCEMIETRGPKWRRNC